MKKWLVFILGLISGIVLTFVLAIIITYRIYDENGGLNIPNGNAGYHEDGMTLFEEERECVSEKNFKVFQVLESGNALASELDPMVNIPTGIVVMFLNDGEASYYDDQTIVIPSGKCAKQIGIYRYISKSEIEKTVPIVAIRDK